MQNMIIKNLPNHITTAITNGTIKPEQVAQLLIEGSITNHLDVNFHKFSAVYRQTNEPLSQYLVDIDVLDKDVLTVVGSGDFLLSLINKGAKNISTFDISIFTKYYQELKVAAMQTLSYEEFLEFFYGNNCFDEELYGRISNYLNKESRDFWDSLFDHYEPKDIENSPMFIRQNVTINNGINSTPYLANEQEYLKTKARLSKISFSFHNLDVLELPYTLKRNFDAILLSNTGDCIKEMGQSLDARLNYLRHKTGRLLNANGFIISTIFNSSLANNSGLDWELSRINYAISTLTLHKRK